MISVTLGAFLNRLNRLVRPIQEYIWWATRVGVVFSANDKACPILVKAKVVMSAAKAVSSTERIVGTATAGV